MNMDLSGNYNGPMRIAHRGIVQVAPENTLGAFEAAVEVGVEGIEIDIRMSKDGEMIVVHDDNLTRLTLGHPVGFSNGQIAEMTWENLANVELPYANHLLDDDLPAHSENELLAIRPMRLLGQEHGRSYQEAFALDNRMASLMRFDDFMTWFETGAHKIFVEIEVKAPGMMKKLIHRLDASPACSRCIVFSGEPDYISEIQQVCAKEGKPDGLKLGANIRVLTEEAKRKLAGMDLYEIGLNDQHISAEDIVWLSGRGIRAFSNLGDYPAWWARICQLGIDGFKSNYVRKYSQWWEEEQHKYETLKTV